MTSLSNPPESDLRADDLWLLASVNEEGARVAADRLWQQTEPVLLRNLVSRGLSDSDAQDLAQSTFVRIWRNRLTFEPKGYAAWIGYVMKVAASCRIDEGRKKRIEPSIDIDAVPEIPARDLPVVEVILQSSLQGKLFEHADCCWLGTTLGSAANKLRILAIQLFLEGMDADSVAATLRSYAPTTRTDLDRWLLDDPLLRCASFLELYKSNDRLTGHLLNPTSPLTDKELAGLMAAVQGDRAAKPPEGWGWDEIFIVLLRFRNGMMNDQVIRRCSLAKRKVEEVVARCLECLPFRSIAEWLTQDLDRLDKAERLRDDGLWRRLVFQYHVCDQLPHKQILERTVPAAEVVGESLTEARLNGWLSSGRLFSELAAYIKRGDRPC